HRRACRGAGAGDRRARGRRRGAGFRRAHAGAALRPRRMIRWARDFRLIPVVLIATVCLFALKVSGIVFDGGYTLADRLQGRNKTDLTIVSGDSVPDYPRIVIAGDPSGTLPAPRAKKSWAQEMFNFNGDGDITGSVEKKEDKPAAPAAKTEAKTDPKIDPKADAKTDVKPPDATKV